MKRLFTFLLAVASVANSYAGTRYWINGIEYELEYPAQAYVTWCNNFNYGASYTEDTIIIPEAVIHGEGAYIVERILRDAFRNSHNLRYVSIPETVTQIDERAFQNADSLPAITLPSGLTVLNTHTFNFCSSLKSVTLPQNLNTIGEGVFMRCTVLDSITLPASLLYIGSWAFNLCDSLSYIVIPDKTLAIGEYAFYQCGNLKSVTFGQKLTALPTRSFADCDLRTVNIPDNITSLGEGVFENNPWLRSVHFSSKITEIPENAFYYCRALDSVSLPSGITSIGKWAFAYCDSLHVVSIPQSVTSIHTEAFKNSKSLHNVILNAPQLFNVEGGLSSSFGKQVKRYVLGDAFTTINDDAFAGCDSLQEVVFGPNVTTIGKRAFANLPNLRTIILPDAITTIDEGTFANSNLESITIGPNITSIAADAFSGCTNLKTVTINSTAIFNQTFTESHSLKDIFGEQVTTYVLGDSITTIGGYTFAGCANLTNVIIGKNVKTIQNYAFRNWTGCTSITIPEQIEKIGGYVFYGCTNLRTVYWNAINCREQYTSNYMFQGIATQIDTIYLGENVEYITETLFAGMTQLTSFTLPAHIKGIRDNAFKDCTFTKVYISDLSAWCQLELGHNPLDIADELYLNGQLVEGELTLPSNITTVASRVFDGYQHITSLIIPDNITTVEQYAFRGTPLRSVTVGSGVVNMNYACYQCDSLTTVYLNAPSFKSSCSSAFGPQVTDYILSENITVIAGWFDGCTNMRAITIPENVTAIETRAFNNCTGLKEINIPNKVTTIGSFAFANCHLNKITLGESIDSIADGAFMDCGLDTVVWNIRNYHDCVKDDTPFKQNVMRPEIGPVKWDITSGIKSFLFGDKVEYVPTYLCQGMYNLTSLIFPKGVTSIGENVFYGCNAVTFIDLPSTLTSVGAGAFGSCGQLDSLYCRAKTPPTIADNTFNNYSTYTSKVFVQQSSLAKYKSAEGWKNFTNYITIPDEDQGIEQITNDQSPITNKVIHNGQLYIRRGDKLFTPTGQQVK